MSQPEPARRICNTITIFTITQQYLATTESENEKLCRVCFDDYIPGTRVARSHCCGTIICLVCLSTAANLRLPESRGGSLPTWATCVQCAALYDRNPLNQRLPLLAEWWEAIAEDGEELDVTPAIVDEVLVTTPVVQEEPVEELIHDDGYEKVTKQGDTFYYTVYNNECSVYERGLDGDGPVLNLQGVLMWGRLMLGPVPTRPWKTTTREEALAGLDVYTFLEYVSDTDSQGDQGESEDDAGGPISSDGADGVVVERPQWPMSGW